MMPFAWLDLCATAGSRIGCPRSRQMRRIQALFVLILVLPGCYAATKATVDMASAQKQLEAARSLGAPESATYAWTMADEYMKKAKDEWSRSDYQAVDKLLKQAQHWAQQAASIAQANEVDVVDEPLQDEPLQDEPLQDSEETTESNSNQDGVWQ